MLLQVVDVRSQLIEVSAQKLDVDRMLLQHVRALAQVGIFSFCICAFAADLKSLVKCEIRT